MSAPHTAAAGAPFLEPTSGGDKWRLCVRDAHDFDPSSMRRAAVEDGVVALVGVRSTARGEAASLSEQLITLLFSRDRFTDADVQNWWEKKSKRLLVNDPAILRK